MKAYKVIEKGATAEYIVERSRFIGTTRVVRSEDEAKAFVKEVAKTYSDATHNCFAFVCDQNYSLMKFSDDGEPQGTAGMPILEVIKNKGLCYTAVVVTRYFGGIKLGAGGLVRAYTEAATRALDCSGVAVFESATRLVVASDYSTYQQVESYLNKNAAIVVGEKEYYDDVKVTLTVRSSDFERVTAELTEACFGRCKIREGETFFYPFKI